MVKWIILFIVSFTVVFGIDYIFRKKTSFKFVSISILIKLILSLACAFLPLGGPIFLRPIQEILVQFYIVLIGNAVANAFFNLIIKKSFVKRQILSFIICTIFFISGTINSQNIIANNYEISSAKVTDDYSFVFISDIHVGSAQELEVIKNTIDEIKTLDIDFLVLGGDITDDYTTKDDMIEFYSYFKDYNVPVYLIYGNHDLQLNEKYRTKDSYNEEELLSAIKQNNITILEDEYVTYKELAFFGRDDKSHNKERLSSEKIIFDNSKYSIVFDHQPSDTKGTNLPTCDLQVSGHTHGGQFAPLNLLYDLFLSPTEGIYEFNEIKEIVSSGASGWRVPFRTTGTCEYEIINIKHK